MADRKEGAIIVTMSELKDWYLELSHSQKQRFLGAVGYDLAVAFRGYGQDAILNPKFWFGVNELHYALYAAINALGAEVDLRTVWDHLFFVARDYNLTDILTSRLASARDQITLSDSMREKGAEATRATRGKPAEVESAGGKGGQKWPDSEVANRLT
jgi:hypothetical protein